MRVKSKLVLLPGAVLLVVLCVSGPRAAERAATGSAASAPRPAVAVPAAIDRSPLAVAVSPDGRFCVSANHTSGSVSLVDLNAGRAVFEHPCGDGPADLVWIDSRRLLVSLLRDDAVALLLFDPGRKRLTTEAVIPVGDEPRGIALLPAALEPSQPDRTAPAPERAFVALTGVDQVAVIDLRGRKVVHRIPVGGQPRTLAVAPNRKWLAVCCSVPGEVLIHETETYELVSRRRVFDDGFNIGAPIILPDSSQVVIPHPINRTFPINEDNIEKGWAIDNRLTKLPLPDGEYWEQKQIGLDVRGRAAGDPNAVALSPGEKWLAVTCGGSRELLVVEWKRIPWPPADPGDFIPDDLRYGDGAMRRVALEGRPVAVEFIDNGRAVVANYLLGALQVVDVAKGEVAQTIPLGGPDTPSPARRGEAIFYDARRSLHDWFSCHTCHTDGHTSGQTFDTVNDGNYDTYKLVPSLRGVTHTAPWTWHGWQESLSHSVRKSFRDTMSTEIETTDADVEALLAFLATLEHPSSPHRGPGGELTAAARRGKAIFNGKAGCVTCHSGDYFTSADTYSVGLESRRYFYPEFNPPSLRGVHARRRFLHDGRADSLEEVLTRHHQPEKLAGEKLTDEELKDLIAYLKSL